MALIRQSGLVVSIKPEGKPVTRLPETTMAKERQDAYEAVGRIIQQHRAGESYARWAAVRTAIRLRDQGTRDHAQDEMHLRVIAKQMRIQECHVGLYVDVVQCLCEMLPVSRVEEREVISRVYKMLDEIQEDGDVQPVDA